MTHDPRCPSLRYVVLGGRVCVCETIAEVRQDERSAAVQRVEALAKTWDVLPDTEPWIDSPASEIIAAIKGDQP